MYQDIHKQYEIEHDYDNESVQDKYYKRAKSILAEFKAIDVYYLTTNLKAFLLKKDFGEESKYFKHVSQETSFDSNLVNFFSIIPEIKSVKVKETWCKELQCCFKDAWINGTYFPSEFRKYLKEVNTNEI